MYKYCSVLGAEVDIVSIRCLKLVCSESRLVSLTLWLSIVHSWQIWVLYLDDFWEYYSEKLNENWVDVILKNNFIAQCSCINSLCPGDPSQHFPTFPHPPGPFIFNFNNKILTLKKCWPRKIVKSWKLSFIPHSIKHLKNN